MKLMTLTEAIKHASEKGQGESQCAKDHRQLAEWLKELRDLRTEVQYLRSKYRVP